MKNIYFTLLSFLASAAFTSCGSDPDNMYGKNKEMRILDEYGTVTQTAYASIISGTTLNIVGGIGDNHIIEVEDETVLTAIYSGRGAMVDGLISTETLLAHLIIEPKKYGTTTVSITDTDIDKTIHVTVQVVDEYKALTVQESSAGGIGKDMMIAFKLGDGNEYRILEMDGRDYVSLEVGEYHFVKDHGLQLSLTTEEKETIWKISIMEDGAEAGVDDLDFILEGLRLPNSVLTKYSPVITYPDRFYFIDTENPDKTFTTGPANTTIKYLF